MKRLGKREILHVLCEGGGELAEGLLKARQVDELWIFVAPRIVGGRDAVRAVAGQGWPLASAPHVKIISREQVGEDLLIKAVPG
jgi:diaminohydroxyphosphoribosylaminopyrimidine deaminase/5-amino-6-(5-phosphoribosylamino)uracil reductase